MGKLQLFEIQLADSRVIYGPGQPLAGAVTVRLAAPLPYRAIKVTCMGSCGVSNKINDTAWTVEEPYFNSTLSLADKVSSLFGEGSPWPSGNSPDLGVRRPGFLISAPPLACCVTLGTSLDSLVPRFPHL
uniref:Arrestin domain containing 1 n=1 Tax=Ornithorhynchus anatinus TaxID=9258 RepID=A0A6I8NB63_ORNAN